MVVYGRGYVFSYVRAGVRAGQDRTSALVLPGIFLAGGSECY